MPNAPVFSIVLTCRNPAHLLQPTLASIREQRWVHPEIIVVDRGSTDGTATWLKAEGDKLTALLRPPGISWGDALNAGVAAAQGEWLLFLQPGDRLVGDMVLSETVNWMKKTEAGVVAGEVAYDDGRIDRLHSRVNPVAGNFLRLSAAFYRATLFAENGSFDPLFDAQPDYEFNVRLWKHHVRFKPIPLRIAAASIPSGHAPGPSRHYREAIQIRHRYFSPLRCAFWDALSLLRWAGAAVFSRTRRGD